jgi:hypothetical protein
MTRHTRNLRRACAIAALVLLGGAPAARADVVLQWSDIAVQLLTTQTPPVSPFEQARRAAVIQLAVFEAVNSITGEYEGYLGSPAAPNGVPIAAPFGASADAAAVAAAHAVLLSFFGGSQLMLDAARDASLATIPDGPAKANGVAVGVEAAAKIIAERNGDGAAPLTFSLPEYPLSPGEWDITPGCPLDSSGNPRGGQFLNWQDVRPFGVPVTPGVAWTQAFRPPPPPAVTSSQYAKDYNEVKSVGDIASTERPADRALVARFYAAASPTLVFATVARQLAEARGDSLVENARHLALISMATTDSLVASFAAKYHYNFWRPVTAIRSVSDDGNSQTAPNVDYSPFITTPCFPSYPSNHASGSGAAAEMARRIYGAAGHALAITVPIPNIGPVTFNYTSLKQITDNVDDARVYGGIHFRFDQDGGSTLGRDVATYIYKNNLAPLHGAP